MAEVILKVAGSVTAGDLGVKSKNVFLIIYTREPMEPRKKVHDVTRHAQSIKLQEGPIFIDVGHVGTRSSEGTK